jgi:cell wall-associated NlpC family hydrolase
VLLPNGTSTWLKKEDGKLYSNVGDIPIPTGKDVVQTAKQFMGLPYLWGGMSGFGFDCSGFTFSIYQAHGVQIPRDASPQSKVGISVQREALQPGDLLFFSNQEGHIVHVSMYVDHGLMIHAPESAKSIEIISIETPRFAETFASARRYLY